MGRLTTSRVRKQCCLERPTRPHANVLPNFEYFGSRFRRTESQQLYYISLQYKGFTIIYLHNVLTERCFPFSGHTCSEEEFKCENLQCVKKTTKCDGIDNCLDGSDEKNCKCLNQQFTCSSGDCLSPEKLRDDAMDCPNGEDEKDTNGRVGCLFMRDRACIIVLLRNMEI